MNPFSLVTGAVMNAASNAFVGGAVNTASNIFYGSGGEGDEVKPDTPVLKANNKNYTYMILLALLVIALIVLIVFIILHHKSINSIKKDLKTVQDKNKELVNMTNKNLDSVKKIITKVNAIGTRIGTTDLTFKYELLPVEKSAAIKNTFGGKNDFVQIPYVNELNLFKTLSPEDQYEYLHMDKSTKRAKYSNML